MKPRVCITGASGGLGKAMAADCASRGWDIYMTDLMEEPLKIFAQGLRRNYGVNVDIFPCDLTDSKERAKLFCDMEEKEYRYKGLINVAGLDYEGRFFDRTRDEISTIVRLNVEGTLDMTHEVLKLRDEKETFLMVTVSSLASFYPMPVKATYAASKRFLLDWSMALREELAGENINVLTLCPSGLLTNDKVIKSITSQGFMGRMTTCSTGKVAANTIDHVIKDKAVYVPGFINRIMRFVSYLLPNRWIARLINRRWQVTRSRIHE